MGRERKKRKKREKRREREDCPPKFRCMKKRMLRENTFSKRIRAFAFIWHIRKNCYTCKHARKERKKKEKNRDWLEEREKRERMFLCVGHCIVRNELVPRIFFSFPLSFSLSLSLSLFLSFFLSFFLFLSFFYSGCNPHSQIRYMFAMRNTYTYVCMNERSKVYLLLVCVRVWARRWGK